MFLAYFFSSKNNDTILDYDHLVLGHLWSCRKFWKVMIHIAANMFYHSKKVLFSQLIHNKKLSFSSKFTVKFMILFRSRSRLNFVFQTRSYFFLYCEIIFWLRETPILIRCLCFMRISVSLYIDLFEFCKAFTVLFNLN